MDEEFEIVPHYIQSEQSVIHSFYINEPLMVDSMFIPLIHTLRTAHESDRIHIFLNSPGGSVVLGMQIINAMLTCHGKITTVLDGEACSMAAIIFLAGHKKIVQQYSRLMLHNFSAGMYGKGHELEAQYESTKSMCEEVMGDMCKSFLTKSELKRMLKGEDFYFNATEVIKRLNK